jgi:hypothetical protein
MVAMGPRQYSVVVALLFVLILSPFGASIGPQRGSVLKTPPTWTIMVYMADDFHPDLPWQENINQMEAALQAPGTNIIVLVDPLVGNGSMLLRIEHDNDTQGSAIISPQVDDSGAVIPPNGTVDMGSPDTLRSFIRFSATNFIADHLVLIMWGHAGGWFGLCPDGQDILTLPEFGEALEEATADISRNLDLIGIDACGEATIEMLYEVYPYADYLVASEKNIPNEGFPYTPILNRLSAYTAQTPVSFAAGLVQDFIDWSRFNSSISASLAVFNLTRMADLKTDLDQLARIGAKYDSLFHESLNDAFASAQTYTEPWNVDLGDLLGRLLNEPLPPDIQRAAMDTMLSYLYVLSDSRKLELENPSDGEHVARATGAVIYAPATGFPDETYVELTLASGPWYQFGRLARHTAPTNYSSQVPSLEYGDSDGDGQPDSVTLTWPGSYESSEASVFSEEGGGLTLIDRTSSLGNRTTFSGEGYLTISANALNGNVAGAHATIRVTLFGRTEIRIQIVEGGRNSTRDTDIRITAKNSTHNKVALSGALRFNLSVPVQVAIGDTIRVEAVDNRTGVVLGEGLALVDANGTAITIEVHRAPQEELPFLALLLLSLLPGLLMLLFDAQLYLGDKKSRKRAR